MTTIERTKDTKLIREILNHPSIYEHITDDFPPDETIPSLDTEQVLFFKIMEGSDCIGLFMTYPHNMVCWELHVALLPKGRGKKTAGAAQQLFKWLWNNTPCRRIVGEAPAYNPAIKDWALRCGMTVYGVNPKSVLKKSVSHDCILLGVSKE